MSSKIRRRKRLRKLFQAPDEVSAEALNFLCEYARIPLQQHGSVSQHHPRFTIAQC